MDSAVDLLYYAPGDGLGHATRAAAILRRLARLGAFRLLACVTTAHTRPLDDAGIPVCRPDSRTPEGLRSAVPALLARRRPRVLVVDTFPFGIAGELTALPCRAVLVARRLQPRWAAWGPPAWGRFAGVLAAEELDGPAIHCGPILLRDADELWPRIRAAAALGVAADEPVVLAVSSDDPGWTRDCFRLLEKIWERLRPRARLRLASPHLPADAPRRVSHYPLLELLPGVDLVIGPGGYNLFHEAQACGVPGIFLPRPRRFDDQAWRARRAPTAASPEALEAQLREMLPSSPRDGAPAYHNGAWTAAEYLRAMLAG